MRILKNNQYYRIKFFVGANNFTPTTDPSYFINDDYIQAYIFNNICGFDTRITQINHKIAYTKQVCAYVDEPFKLNNPKFFDSAFNLENTDKILSIFSIDPLHERYEDDLHEFLKKRNKLAHGSDLRRTNIDFKLIERFSDLVVNLMYDMFINIEKRFLEIDRQSTN